MNEKTYPTEYEYDISLHVPSGLISGESCNSFLKNLAITKIGYFKNARGHFIKRSGIDEYILIYCVAGKGWIETGSRKRFVSRGDIVFCDKNKPHAYGADADEPWSINWAHFTGDGVPELFTELGISEHTPSLFAGENKDIIALMGKAYKALSSGYSLPNIILASTYLQEVFCHILKLVDHPGQRENFEKSIENVIQFMMKNIYKVILLDKFADYAKLSKYHFVRIFKKTTGYSPMEYFNRLKIQKACDLLETSDMNIKEISDSLSFNTPYYFSEVFKKVIGVSPSHYRKLQKTF